MRFELDERLRADTFEIGDWPLCKILLMNDKRYPWVILVPRRTGLREIFDLEPAERVALAEESAVLGLHLMELCQGHKLNVAALGNVVGQLHLHHVVRFPQDEAWPAPVWGLGSAQLYASHEAEEWLRILRNRLAESWPVESPPEMSLLNPLQPEK